MNRKNFEGRNIDEAIALACSFFAVERKELDIEIIREPSAGIFGLGTKKAVSQARKQRKNLPEQQEKILAGAPVQEQAADMEEIQINGEDEDFDEDEMDSSDEEIQNPEELKALLKETTAELLKPISTQYDLTIDLETRPITLRIEDDENSGLIIGRDGQTITALQYILNRIIACKWGYNTRVQLDTGQYRQKQQEKLKELALSLAEKSKASGRAYSTRPLSSYHRRVVHMALQDDKSIFTRSKGDGPMKRVLIIPKKERRDEDE